MSSREEGWDLGVWQREGDFLLLHLFLMFPGVGEYVQTSMSCCCVGHTSSPAWSLYVLQQSPLLADYSHYMPKMVQTPVLIIAGISFILGPHCQGTFALLYLET